MHYQLQNNLKENGLHCSQVLFRVDLATDSCLMQLTDFVLTGMDKGMHTGMILTELQKTFDKLNHTILLEKMTCLGFKTPVTK